MFLWSRCFGPRDTKASSSQPAGEADEPPAEGKIPDEGVHGDGSPSRSPIPAPFLLIPLYIYPDPGQWDPLYEAARKHPSIRFVVVVNPHNGPGESPPTDGNYVAAVGALTRLDNVTILGYVGCGWSCREVAAIRADIDSWSNWCQVDDKDAPPLRLDGVFFDEAPSDVAHLDRAAQLAGYARTALDAGSSAGRAVVVSNPGVRVDAAFYSSSDCVVALEHAFSEQRLEELSSDWPLLTAKRTDLMSRTAVIVHSFDGSDENLATLLRRIQAVGVGGVFITDQEGSMYNRWPSAWSTLAASLDGGRGGSGTSSSAAKLG